MPGDGCLIVGEKAPGTLSIACPAVHDGSLELWTQITHGCAEAPPGLGEEDAPGSHSLGVRWRTTPTANTQLTPRVRVATLVSLKPF
jgi:hypothetical protein